MKLTLDLHDIYNHGAEIEKALQRIFDEAIAKKAPMIAIIPGKGSGQLKKHVLRFFEQKRSSAKNMRIEKPSKNFGTIKVHFNWNEPGRR
jgi:dsDNA-specific endonuclease/ATPase MutS2